MPIPRLLFVVLVSLSVGFGLGYFVRPGSAAVPAAAPDRTEQRTVVAATTIPATPPVHPDAAARGALVFPTDEQASPRARWQHRRETLRWLREIGAPVRLHLFHGKEIAPGLAKLLDLAPDEAAQITQIANDAELAITRLRAAQATSTRSSDGQQLIVEAPPLDAADSAGIYDRLQSSLHATLGAERYAIFNEVVGESLEWSYDRFGLNAVRYELNLQSKQTSPRGTPLYEYKRSFVDATSEGRGSSTNTVPLDQLDPLLTRFVPPELANEQTPPPSR